MNIAIFSSEQELNEAGAQLVTGLVLSKPDAVLGLATGSTPIGIYREIIRAYDRKMVSFKRVRTFNLDEYVGLDANHPQSYRYYMNEHLFRHLDVAPENIHIPDGTAKDLAEECRRYDRLLEQLGPIDLQLLGIGHNGHIGFNEPDRELSGRTHVAELNESTRQANARFFQNMDEVPTHAVTMGVGDILKAKTVVLVAKGADKAEILHRALTGPITTDCPASLLQTHPRLIVLADAEAGRLLR